MRSLASITLLLLINSTWVDCFLSSWRKYAIDCRGKVTNHPLYDKYTDDDVVFEASNSTKQSEPQLSEEEFSQLNFDRLMLPQRIGEAFNKASYYFAIAIIISGTALQLNGYSWFLKDGHLEIVTLQERQFITEVVRKGK